MLDETQMDFLRELSDDYAKAISGGLSSIATVYEALAALEAEPQRWLAVAELLALAKAQGESLALLNRFVDDRRSEWRLLGGFDPVEAYGLGCAIAESLIVCHLARTPDGALALPIVGIDRLEELYSLSIRQWVESTRSTDPLTVEPTPIAPTPAEAPSMDPPPMDGERTRSGFLASQSQTRPLPPR